jgi:hypothetical protein
VSEEAAIVLTFAVAVIGAVILIVASMNNRRRLREMHHRERLAMIQAGLIPSPELDPAGFEAGTGLRRRTGRAEKFRTAGVGLIGFGLALIVLIGVAAGQPEIGFGVGGAWAILGGALLANYFFMREDPPATENASWTPPRGNSQEPPANIAP